MFDKKVIHKSIIIILIILLILIAITFIRRAFSRYESDAQSSADVNLAFFVVNESFVSEEFSVGEIEPLPTDATDKEQYIKQVEFTVQNYKDTLSTDVPLKYDIRLFATTNLPLKYELYQYGDDGVIKTDPCVVSNELIYDEYGTCYREIKATSSNANGNDFFFDFVVGDLGKEIDKFLLKIWLPDHTTDDLASEENYIFADLVEYVKLEINAKQIISEEEKN